MIDVILSPLFNFHVKNAWILVEAEGMKLKRMVLGPLIVDDILAPLEINNDGLEPARVGNIFTPMEIEKDGLWIAKVGDFLFPIEIEKSSPGRVRVSFCSIRN